MLLTNEILGIYIIMEFIFYTDHARISGILSRNMFTKTQILPDSFPKKFEKPHISIKNK